MNVRCTLAFLATFGLVMVLQPLQGFAQQVTLKKRIELRPLNLLRV
jgi:hypothetical protein